MTKSISLYKGVTDKYGAYTEIQAAIQDIITGKYKEQIEALRVADPDRRDALKRKLPAVTWSGSFNPTRKKDQLMQYSALICMDIDKLEPEQLEDLKGKIWAWDLPYFTFISPSGNGLKILFKTKHTHDRHEDLFRYIQQLILEKLGVEVDESGKDVCRLCFLSSDEDAILNTAAPEIEIPQTFAATKKAVKKAPAPAPASTDEILDDIKAFTDRLYQYQEGNRNNYIFMLSLNANRRGIPQDDALNYARSLAHDLPESDVFATVKSAYLSNAHEHGKYKNNHRYGHEHTPAPGKTSRSAAGHNFDESVKFWYFVENLDKATGELKREYRFCYDDAIQFLQRNGFYMIDTGGGQYQFIHLKGQIVEIVNELYIKKFMLDYLKQLDDPDAKKIREMFRRGSKNYASKNLFEGLDYFYPAFKKDTPTTAYVYFTNCFLQISAAGIETKKYDQLDGNIWRKQVIDFEFTYRDDFDRCDFSMFLSLAILGDKRKAYDAEALDPSDKTKLASICSTIGYLLHRHKNPALTKAVVAVDKKLRRTGEANGRSGKSLLGKGISKMMNVCIIDGMNFKFDNAFPFQSVNIDTELINFNDVSKNFDFQRLFGMITEEFTFEKKGRDSITMKFDDSPKFYLSTNYSLKGDGESNKGRQQVVEFSYYFNTDNTPSKEFGKMFFSDWDTLEWSKFYSFMIHCIQYYFKNGLVDFPLEHYAANKFIDGYSLDMYEWLEENIRMGEEYEKDKLIADIKAAFPRKSDAQKNYFTKMLKSFCDANGLEYNAHIDSEDRRDKRNNIDYVKITKRVIEI